MQLTSELNHPNTITIYDYGRTSEGIFYYAMEYLEGITFHDLVSEQGALPEGRVVHLLRQLCGSLAEAHAGGLIHRDVKPANLMLTCRGGVYDLVKVLDFGLVKAFGGEQDDRLTASHSLTGTPSYMSPEAISHPDTIDARTDIYAVGAVGYFLLTGTPVFAGNGLVELCQKHIQESPEPPSKRLGKPVSAGLEQVLLELPGKKTGGPTGNCRRLARSTRKARAESAVGPRRGESLVDQLPVGLDRSRHAHDVATLGIHERDRSDEDGDRGVRAGGKRVDGEDEREGFALVRCSSVLAVHFSPCASHSLPSTPFPLPSPLSYHPFPSLRALSRNRVPWILCITCRSRSWP